VGIQPGMRRVSGYRAPPAPHLARPKTSVPPTPSSGQENDHGTTGSFHHETVSLGDQQDRGAGAAGGGAERGGDGGVALTTEEREPEGAGGGHYVEISSTTVQALLYERTGVWFALHGGQLGHGTIFDPFDSATLAQEARNSAS
jgi:hypothetical protein